MIKSRKPPFDAVPNFKPLALETRCCQGDRRSRYMELGEPTLVEGVLVGASYYLISVVVLVPFHGQTFSWGAAHGNLLEVRSKEKNAIVH